MHNTETKYEHSVPWFWPMAAAMEMEAAGLRAWEDELRFIGEAAEITDPDLPDWATKNDILLDLDTMRLRDFGGTGGGLPVIVDAPYAGHSATIADYAPGQSLVETLLAAGLGRVLVTDWKPATSKMRDFDIDKYLAEINVAVDDLGGRAILVGLCQGGWMSAMFAARFPAKVAALVLAGSPIDTDAGDGPIRRLAHETPLSVYEEMVAAGDGRMPGQFMLAGWKNMHAGQQYIGKFVDLYQHIEDRNYIERTERFERWYENPIDLPGRYYLQAIDLLFKQNLLAKGAFVGLGETLSLSRITCPLFLLAGKADDITTPEQVFAAEGLVGTPHDAVQRTLVEGGHIGLFMGRKTLGETWPGIASWVAAQGAA
ncbi:Polyhydroxyalkanoic acid synthase [Rhodovulum sp. P5]|uniref:alpha/beta fold hydrolase n=1 Tax=Rhodovulum sp. P5 TaxID=1564506 RepID=UPI0009C2CF8D|nr:alpha/beta fold hydrolase [Rhodovulum sp. P5]ARE38622.1 Polyhydroxyalkanoic acid synthase [Rhodovulum sp. P5]